VVLRQSRPCIGSLRAPLSAELARIADAGFCYKRGMATYTVTLRAWDGSTGIRGLRLILKRLLRQHSLRCVSVREGTEARRPKSK
jgi:hypothetical protein